MTDEATDSEVWRASIDERIQSVQRRSRAQQDGSDSLRVNAGGMTSSEADIVISWYLDELRKPGIEQETGYRYLSTLDRLLQEREQHFPKEAGALRVYRLWLERCREIIKGNGHPYQTSSNLNQ